MEYDFQVANFPPPRPSETVVATLYARNDGDVPLLDAIRRLALGGGGVVSVQPVNEAVQTFVLMSDGVVVKEGE